MKNFNLLISFILLITTQTALAQEYFSTDFENYEQGDLVAAKDTTHWRTWSSKTGGTTEDAIISTKYAASGTKSCKIIANQSDFLLKFGKTLSTGTLTIKFKMYSITDSYHYFNIQSNIVPAEGCAMEYDFTQTVIATESVNFHRNITSLGSYPENKWFDYELRIDLDNNIWSQFVDGKSVGSQRSGYHTIGSINFVAFRYDLYIDDVSYSYDANKTVYNGTEAGLDYIDEDPIFGIAGKPYLFNCKLYNAGTDTIHSIEYEVLYAGDTTVYQQNDLQLPPNTSYLIVPPPHIFTTKTKWIQVKILKVNGKTDLNNNNNTARRYIPSSTPAPKRRTIIEHLVSTSDGNSPVNYYFMKQIKKLDSNYVIPIAVHFNDVMTIPEYVDAIEHIYKPAPPSGTTLILDRTAYSSPYSLYNGYLSTQYLQQQPTADIEIGAKYNEENDILDVSVKLIFLDNAVNKHLNIILTENGVLSSEPEYNQANLFAGHKIYAEMGGYEDFPNPVPANLMVYNHVARLFDQSVNIKPILGGNTKIYHYSFKLHPNWNPDSMSIVAVLTNSVGTDNANDATIAQAVQNGYILATNNPITQSDIKIYPNPAAGNTNIALKLTDPTPVNISIQDMLGRVQYTENHELLQGEINLPINLTHLTPGTYQVLVKTESGTANSKLIIVR